MEELESIDKSMSEMFRQHDYKAMYDFYKNYIRIKLLQALQQREWISVEEIKNQSEIVKQRLSYHFKTVGGDWDVDSMNAPFMKEFLNDVSKLQKLTESLPHPQTSKL